MMRSSLIGAMIGVAAITAGCGTTPAGDEVLVGSPEQTVAPQAGRPPDVCKANGHHCGTNNQCCSALCSNHTCAPQTCSADGVACGTDTECCTGSCINGFCGGICPKEGSVCNADSQCCSLSCVGGFCACLDNGTACTFGAQCCSRNCASGTCM